MPFCIKIRIFKDARGGDHACPVANRQFVQGQTCAKLVLWGWGILIGIRTPSGWKEYIRTHMAEVWTCCLEVPFVRSWKHEYSPLTHGEIALDCLLDLRHLYWSFQHPLSWLLTPLTGPKTWTHGRSLASLGLYCLPHCLSCLWGRLKCLSRRQAIAKEDHGIDDTKNFKVSLIH